MGKLRFTITYILFWIIIVFSCLLAENFALLSSDHMGGMNMTSLYMLTFSIIFMFVFYYFNERKNNGITIDKILLPIIGVFGLLSILTVWWQGPREFINPDDGYVASIAFSPKEKISYTLQIVVWCAVLYGSIFINNRYSISRKWLRWLPLVYVWGVLACSLVDLVMEFTTIIDIFNGTYEGNGIAFIIYNSNVWGHVLLVGLFSCVILNLKKFKLVYYFVMVHLFIMIIFTSCATAFFSGLTVIIAYTIFEILSIFNTERKKSIRLLTIYLAGVSTFFALFTILVLTKVPMFHNFWDFINRQIIQKDYSTLTSRTQIWASIFRLLSQNPIDFIFGLGYKTGNAIFTQYFLTFNSHGFAIRSAHNGIMEVFLRHGLFGLSFYAAAFMLFAYGVVVLFKNKKYRVACFHIVCAVGLMMHSIAESTMFLTPNIGGTYLTLVFFLPVVNETKNKYFAKLNDDLQQSTIEETRFTRKGILYFINTLTLGLIVSLASCLAINYIHSNVCALISYIILIVLSLASLFIVAYISTKLEKQPFKESFSSLVMKPIKDNCVVLTFTLVVGLVFAVILPMFGTFDLFVSLLYTICVFVLFNFAFSLLYKPENNQTLDAINYQFTTLLRNISSEAPNE